MAIAQGTKKGPRVLMRRVCGRQQHELSTRVEGVISCYRDQWRETASDKAAEKYPGGTFSE